MKILEWIGRIRNLLFMPIMIIFKGWMDPFRLKFFLKIQIHFFVIKNDALKQTQDWQNEMSATQTLKANDSHLKKIDQMGSI